MLSELNEVWTAVLSTVSACGGVGSLLYVRHNRKMKALEAKLAEVNVAKAKIEGKSDEWGLYKDQLDTANKRIVDLLKINAEKEDRHMNDLKDWQERFDKQTDRLRSVQRDLIAANDREKGHIRREGVLERRIAYLLTWICKKGDCDHGEPPRERLRGRTFDEGQAAEIENENTITINLTKE